MTQKNKKTRIEISGIVLSLLLGLPWVEIVADIWRPLKRLWQGLSAEGMHEVLEYEAQLELQDRQGRRALFRKRQKVRYLQDNIVSYLDQAWGDGSFLKTYRCSPGVMADTWREGHKTHILISRRKMKHRGEIDEFSIEREIRDGFLTKTEQWVTEISHRTKSLKVQIVFPQERPPTQVSLIEGRSRRTRGLGEDALRELPDGRWRVQWELDKPRLYERYILSWDW